MKGQPSLITCLIAFLLTSCSTSPVVTQTQAIKQVEAPYEQGAITVSFITDTDLNAWHNIANSCTVLIIQAEKSSTLMQLLANPAALGLLFSSVGAQDEILKVDRYAAMPGQQTTLHIDRSENARYVAIVAGYYPHPQKQHMALVAVPVISASEGWWRPTWHATLSPLTLSLRLGRDAISDIKGATPLAFSLPQSNVAAESLPSEEER